MSDAPQTTPKSAIERQLGPNDKGARGFVKWLAIALPGAYRDLIPKIKALSGAQGLSGTLGDAATPDDSSMLQAVSVPDPVLSPSVTQAISSAPASSSWTDSLSSLVTAWGQAKLTNQQLDTMQQITNINLQRAQAGLSPLPLDPAKYGLQMPGVNIGLTSSTQSMLMWVAAGFGALLLLSSLTKRGH